MKNKDRNALRPGDHVEYAFTPTPPHDMATACTVSRAGRGSWKLPATTRSENLLVNCGYIFRGQCHANFISSSKVVLN